MRINLTLIIQFCNILITLWFLQKFFWKKLLACVFKEQKEQEQLVLSCALLEKEIEDKKQSIAQEQAQLTKTLQEKLQKLEIATELKPHTPQVFVPLRTIVPDETIVTDGVEKITSLLDKKF